MEVGLSQIFQGHGILEGEALKVVGRVHNGEPPIFLTKASPTLGRDQVLEREKDGLLHQVKEQRGRERVTMEERGKAVERGKGVARDAGVHTMGGW